MTQKLIYDFIESRERVPIIDPNKRKSNERPPLDPAKKERDNGYLKDMSVKGFTKISELAQIKEKIV